VTRAKWQIRKNNRRFSTALRDFASAVRASLAAGAPPPVIIDAGNCARIYRCALLAGDRSLTSE